MTPFKVIVLAAGKGTRMRSSLPKVLHPVCGRSMVQHVVTAAVEAGAESVHVVVGHGAGQVTDHLAATPQPVPVSTIEQTEQLGTGHAVMVCQEALAGFDGPVLILSGDVPLVPTRLIAQMVQQHEQTSGLTLVSVVLDDPTGYGRVVRDDAGQVARIVEQKDANEAELAVCEVNAGIYLVDAKLLFEVVSGLSNDNAQGEYYLTDGVAAALSRGASVQAVVCDTPALVAGVNSRAQLAQVTGQFQRQITERLMAEGVTLIDPARVTVDVTVTVGNDSVIYPGVTLTGATRIGSRCTLHPNVRISDSTLGDGIEVKDGSLITEATLDGDNTVGPNAHLRPLAHLASSAKIGNYVEIKKATIGVGSKVNHLSYVGDATVGDGVNIGAGTITCNYDGVNKHHTVLEDGVFVGSDTQLVAPVRVGAGAVIGAGSTITGDVPAGSLSISRTPQKNIDGWVARKRQPQQ